MRFKYTGYQGISSECDVEIKGSIIIATELDNNPGTSITNCAEKLANEVCETYNIDILEVIWIEHYPVCNGVRGEIYNMVKFSLIDGKLGNPQWRPLMEDEYKRFKIEKSSGVKK